MNCSKKFLLGIQLILLGSIIESNEIKSNCEFAILIPSYNNAKFYEENLLSACWQKSTNPYHIYYINDCSTDDTGKLVEGFVKKHQLENIVTIIHNPENMGAGANTYNTIHNYISNHKIVVILDGDDKFAHNNVLLTLEKYYKDPDLWLTHGRSTAFGNGYDYTLGSAIPKDLLQTHLIRKHVMPQMTEHLRTFKAGLFKKINKEYFYYNGKFMRTTADTAFMLAMLEMCCPKDGAIGKNHVAFIDEVLYYYRRNNPISVYMIKPALQMEIDAYLRTLEPFQPLEQLD